jgi:hypothetical protein
LFWAVEVRHIVISVFKIVLFVFMGCESFP